MTTPDRDTEVRAAALRYRKIFARNFVAARLDLGLTQAQVAQAIGRTQQAVSRYEVGDESLTIETMSMLARAVGRAVPQMLTPGAGDTGGVAPDPEDADGPACAAELHPGPGEPADPPDA